MELTYAPGACNIGPDEIARRRKAAVAGLIATIALGVALLLIGSTPGSTERLLVALPLTGAAIGWIQARRRFCMAYGLAGTFNLGKIGEMQRVSDERALAADRRTAVIIAAQGLALGLVGALAFLALPLSIQS
ncbi:MAG: hypothetical protein EBU83_03080 [bacterium]|jgi:hypothetical protein|nr:hypothetical protein [Chloroflexota bacterium]NBO52409.1 hypothetical protein [Candidatus Aquidulcis sp.]